MSRKNMGILGGVLIAAAALLTGSGLNFGTESLKNTTSLVLFLVGLGVAILLILGNRLYASYCAIAAMTIAVIIVIDLLRGSGLDLSVKLVALVVGVGLALFSTLGSKK
jgi:uncharacterized membrane protein YjgN (DUF898 family)